MKMDVPCIACFVRQAVETVERATNDPALRLSAIKEVCSLVDSVSAETTPPDFAERVYATIYRMTDNADPFVDVKRAANELVLALEPRLQEAVKESREPLLSAIKLSIAGNSMDLGVVREYGDVNGLAEHVLVTDLAVDDYGAFVEGLQTSEHVVIVGDNNGEIVFDRMLLEQMKRVRDCRYTYVVRGGPVINDVTRQDAIGVGIDRLARIVDTGAAAPGLVLARCSDEARRVFLGADVVVSKGQGNYEALSDAPREVFFLLLVKCGVVSKDLSAPVGGAVVKRRAAAG